MRSMGYDEAEVLEHDFVGLDRSSALAEQLHSGGLGERPERILDLRA